MSATSSRRAAVVLVAALAAAPAAARAEIVPSISPVMGDAQGLTGMVSSHSRQVTKDALSLAADTTLAARSTAGHTVFLTRRTVRNVVVTVYAVLEPVGQIAGGRNAAAVTSPATGQIVVSWQTARSGCSAVAFDNGLILPIQRVSPSSVQVLRRNTHAGAGAGRIRVNVLC